jgi:Tfp pilus assembly protein PilO
MIKDIQKAGMWKRISAALLDIVVLIIIAEAFILLFSWMTGFSDHLKKYDALENELADIAEEYYKEYGVEDIISFK